MQPVVQRDQASHRGPLVFVGKFLAYCAAAAVLVYVAGLLVTLESGARGDVQGSSPAYAQGERSIPQSATEYYPAQFPAPRGEPEAPIPTF